MNKYKYKIEYKDFQRTGDTDPMILTVYLNEMGKDGWELISIEDNFKVHCYRMIWKHEILILNPDKPDGVHNFEQMNIIALEWKRKYYDTLEKLQNKNNETIQNTKA